MLTRPELNNGCSPNTKPRPHAIVIGSGFGGLAAAVRLGARGYRVTVVERLDAPGGRAYVFRQDGFTFDGGPTIITAPFLLEELWELCGRKLKDDIDLRALSPFYIIRFHDGETLTCCSDPEEMRREVQRISPQDVKGYERFMVKSKEIYQIGFEQLGHVPFDSWTDMARLLPQLFRLKSYKTIYSLAARYVKNERLRFFLSFHPLFVGGNPFNVTSIYGLIAFLERRYGVHFAMGGTGSIVNGLIKLIEGQGGSIRFRADVQEITLKGQRATGVRLSNGETLKADIVVSNADVAWTYRNLLPKTARHHWTDRRIEKARYSMSLFVWYFGTNRTYPKVPHHTILLGPRYKELLQDIFEKKHLARDFSLYLHRPTATDPSLAPQGSDAFYVLSPVPHLDGDADWKVEAEPYRARISQYLSSTVLPGFEDHISTSRIITPLHFQDNLMSYKGAAFSFEPVLTQSAWFRPHNRSEDIERLYLVGAGTHPGAGVPGVLSSARVLDRIVPHASVLA
ncbi:MAG: phytoene desaturase [Hyphomicrobium sp.]